MKLFRDSHPFYFSISANKRKLFSKIYINNCNNLDKILSLRYYIFKKNQGALL